MAKPWAHRHLSGAAVIAAYAAPGATLRSVGELFGCSRSTIQRLLQRHGEPSLLCAKGSANMRRANPGRPRSADATVGH